jgi:predicted LPLAT superfamily acyltransferase
LVSHLGDVEACRALAQLQGGKTINALVFKTTSRPNCNSPRQLAILSSIASPKRWKCR